MSTFRLPLMHCIMTGQLWGLPKYAFNSVALIYNKDLLPEVPATFEELVEVGKELTKNGQYGLL